MRRLTRRMWEHAPKQTDEKALAGPVAVLAEHVAGLVAERRREFDTDEHRLAVEHYLAGGLRRDSAVRSLPE